MSEVNSIQVRNPRNGLIDYQIIKPSLSDINSTCTNLKLSQNDWAASPIDFRISKMLEWADIIDSQRDEIIKAESEDTGRWRIATESPDAVIWGIRGWCENAKTIIDKNLNVGKSSTMPNVKLYQQLVPYSLLGVISPWNFPLLLSSIDAIPALIAGCAAIVKPSEITPRFIEIIQNTIEKVPDLQKVFRYTVGDGETGQQIINNANVICFTGSVATGRKVAEACARNFIPVFLELGGKDPVIITDTADIDLATDSVLRGSVHASGQICFSIERVYVDEKIHDDFISLLVSKSKNIDLNDKNIHKGHVGPMIFEKQAKIIDDQIEDAMNKGAKILSGGKSEEINGGKFLRPTVISDVNHSMKIMKDETFGPIMPIMKFSDKNEAIKLANDTAFGLSAAVIAGNETEAMEIGKQINAGGVSLMDTTLTGAILRDAEKNSFNFSGMGGSRMGPGSIMRFFRKKALMTNTDKPIKIEDLAEI